MSLDMFVFLLLVITCMMLTVFGRGYDPEFLMSTEDNEYLSQNYTVGGDMGWDPASNSTSWLNRRDFYLSDHLVFIYKYPHSVLEVDQESYLKCNSTNLLINYTDDVDATTLANYLYVTSVRLEHIGRRYFICGAPMSCSDSGMRLAVTISDRPLFREGSNVWTLPHYRLRCPRSDRTFYTELRI